ncbi:hypothetical protein M3Y98_00236200 [Aphelenchoides besseyi]|nr:hypothetical protein M3Y98_00236200 [Aphelenchoides besseyi]
MISARLANLRERWSTPENWANRQQPTIPVKTVQNSSDDSIKEQSLRPQHQKKQKRRKRRDRHRASAQPTPPLSSSSCDRADSAISRFQETRKLLGLSNEQKASPSDQWPFDFGERSLADERVIHSVKSQNDKTEESVGAKKHSIEKKEASLDYVPAPIPTPLTPESIGRLNLAQLTDDEERDSKLNWSEVEVYERSSHVPNETNSVTKTKRIPKTQKPKKSEISKQSNEHRFPEWLRLVPREDRTSSSRLLKVDFNAARRETLTARQTIFIDKNTNVLDSGVVVETPRNGIAGLSFPMSPESVRRLIALCDEQNL